MLRRRISETLRQWKAKPNHLPLVIMGIRQCGKTYIAQQFAKENYKHVVYINFLKEEDRKKLKYLNGVTRTQPLGEQSDLQGWASWPSLVQ